MFLFLNKMKKKWTGPKMGQSSFFPFFLYPKKFKKELTMTAEE